jgi:hypothetical protein
MRAAVIAALLGVSAPALAATNTPSEIAILKAQMAQMQERLDQLEQAQAEQAVAPVAAPSATQSNDNAFNPAIGAVLNGHYASFTGKDPNVAGFGAGEEGGRTGEGLAIDEAEINFKSNVDDKFTATLTASLAEEDSETEIELEEANIRTLGLPGGLGAEAGRFLMPVGYLNEHHGHTDDFADRPLPNRVFLNNSYKDDGVLASWMLPVDFYAEIGGGVVRGNDFPGGGSGGDNSGAWTAYGKVGGDIGDNQNWLIGLSTLQARPGERAANDDTVLFHGDSDLYAASLRYIWDPTGNAQEQEVTLQGEYFWRNEDGTYEDTDAGTGAVAYDGHQSGWYAQGVYKFAPQWRAGMRYSRLNPGDVPAGLAGSALDGDGHDPWNAALMADWTNSEFSRVRLQYGHEEPSAEEEDDQIILQYIMSIGAHPAHTF